LGLGVVAFLITTSVRPAFWRKAALPMIIAASISAAVVQLFGEMVNGAYRWIQVGGISFQAVELIKLSLIIWLADFLVTKQVGGELSDFKKTTKYILIVMGILGAVVAWLQSDLGSTVVLVSMVAAMSYVIGVPILRLAPIAGVVIIGLILAIASSGYRRDRFMTFLQPERDCQDVGYQACQALITVGSGGIFGKGIAASVQAYGYLPEAANDSIFAIMAEKFGFVGMVSLIMVFMVLFWRIKHTMERAPDSFSRLICVGVLAWLSTQTFINIGAMVGLLPLKGITLPLVSYGGTSILFVAGAIGMVYSISRYTTYTVNNGLDENGGINEDNSDRRGNRRPYYTVNRSR
jgi:cell division protein FtsW